MDQVVSRAFSREAFDRWLAAQPSGRYERVDGEVVELPAELWEHVSLKAAIFVALSNATSDPHVQVVMDGLAVAAGDNDFLPDVAIHTGEPIPRKSTRIPHPVVVIEVLSPSTTRVDSTFKLAAYFRVPSIEHYLLFRADRRAVIQYQRGSELPLHPPIGPLTLDPPGMTIDLMAIYDRAGVA